jgi:Protein of unknown function (DUF3108)
METRIKTHPYARCRRAILMVTLASAVLPASAQSGEKTSWPTAVQAHYSLRYNGFEVGRLDVNSDSTTKSYSLAASAKISALFGAFKWSGSSNVSGAIERGTPSPAAFAFDWHQNKKDGTTQIAFNSGVASQIAIKPPPRIKPDTTPLRPADKMGAFDPMSAILMLTKADGRPPCDRRVGIFDGKQRYDVVLTPKRTIRLKSATAGGPPETAFVCRIMYEPIAGHRDNADTKAYAENRDAEVVMRRIPGSEMLIPYSMTIPTTWGTGSMVTEKIEITTEASGRIALTN